MGKHYRILWTLLVAILVITFSLLGFFGKNIYRHAPPIPDQVMTQSGQVLMTKQDILAGQSAWQSVGGMELGSIWGHGALQAPDWSADWLHRELMNWLDLAAQDKYGRAYEDISGQHQAELRYALKQEYRHDEMNPDTGVLTISNRRHKAMQETATHYIKLFGSDPSLAKLRNDYAMIANMLPGLDKRKYLTNFFFWTAWVEATDRPDSDATYTNNWPHEPLIGNTPTSENMVWSLVSILVLIAGTGGLIWIWSFVRNHEDDAPKAPPRDPLANYKLTPSQRALGKYVFATLGLFLLQIMIGGLLAHYTTENDFYGLNIQDLLPYSVVRTWHLQLALFWIATGFLSAGLFLVPFIYGGRDPKYHKLGVDVLFWALVVVISGTLLGTWMGIMHWMPYNWTFWLGVQGYEYVDMGRLWQIGKFLGIAFWALLMLRAMVPALKKSGDKSLMGLLMASVLAIGLFYGAGFFYGQHTNITIMEYWRWYIVHLWVEGFFEVFATTALAFIFYKLGLVSKSSATIGSLASASLFMLGGVPGTFHHLYFSGVTTPVVAIGAAFSALEVVPLIVLGYEAWENWSLKNRAPWMEHLRWPLAFFVAVAFWNMVGAGVFGFMVNTPIVLYYSQGVNTTATHAHAALFGVYGMLAIGFCLLILRYLRPRVRLSNKLMRQGFWCLNIGLVLMIALSLLPVGFIQLAASVAHGYWYARSAEFIQSNLLESLRWLRMLGDVVFIYGALCVGIQAVKCLFSRSPNPEDTEGELVTATA